MVYLIGGGRRERKKDDKKNRYIKSNKHKKK